MTNKLAHNQSYSARLLLTTALGTILAVNGVFSSAAFADSGLPCEMLGGACVISTDGVDGVDGHDGEGDNPGQDGTLGSPAGDITTEVDSVENLISNFFSPITITAIGGSGGSGGDAGSPFPYTDRNSGGNGKPGQDGGTIINAVIGDTTSGVAEVEEDGDPNDAVSIISGGGNGGGGGVPTEQEGDEGAGVSAAGGNGKDVTATVGGTWTSNSGNGLYAASLGGTGGQGKSTNVTLAKDGTPGGNGGNSGDVTVTVTGDMTGLVNGAAVISAGGDGGHGGDGLTEGGASGGTGGNAGNAGQATATLAAGATVESTDANAAGLLVGSYGGAGGAGGGGSDAGSAGAGGNADNASATVYGNVYTSGLGDSYGVLVQSIGGVGGDGGHSGSWFNPTNGNGNQGGTAGTATISGSGAVIQTGTTQNDGDRESGAVAQSIGGGGGVGPSSTDGWFAVGGNGGDGSSGNTASASLTDSSVTTYGFGSAGIVAQSIGGGGGTGGDATNSDGAIVNMVVGGTGGAGGNAADAFAANKGNGTVITLNDHAQGVVLQSIGGGGGAGGAGYGTSVSGVFGASIAVGGAGGSGGSAGTVNAAQANNNSGGIQTSGAESFGILGQSIGGGGGSGGASTAKSIVESGGDFPSLSLSLATGGTAGGGGSASAVYLENSGLITTAGNGAAGMIGQAIGGGGGTGGDADGSASASGGGFNFSATVSHGGNGGGAGNGGDVTAINSGLIITRGESADGMLVQSIGGGGGAGGAGDALSSTGENKSLSVEIGLGGKSAGGGEGYTVSATNSGAILTLGDGAHGILAQTIGGGGGRGGGGAASNSGTIGLGAAIGAKGGNGGDTYYNGSNSQVTNSGTIVTFGADAGGILAQSIGGGGGAGGKAGTSLGSSTSNNDGSNGSDDSYSSTVGSIADQVKNDYQGDVVAFNDLETLLVTANSFLGANNPRSNTIQYLDDTAGSGGSIDLSNVSTTNTLTVAVGGTGGAGGAGGDITATNTGSVATMGLLSDAIVVQSIGGGGGKGGAAATSQTENWKSPGISSGVSVGGGTQGSSSDPYATNGAQASITNSGQVITVGALANGLVAQSIAMGGGIGGSTTTTSVGTDGNATLGFSVTVGGSSAAANGSSEAASVTSSGAITTLGHDSYGIIAQSVSGGGGIVKTVAANLDFANGSAVSSTSKDFSADISLGTDDEVRSGNSGAAIVTTTAGGTITTFGDNGIGILAQSVAGGGGLALGGKPDGDNALALIGGGGKEGSVNQGGSLFPNDNQGVSVGVGADINTSGKGGVGVFAQSVGGGGGIAGDIGWSMQTLKMVSYLGYAGDGGDVSVTVDQGVAITTNGNNAPGIIAQSVGGGGGWITNKNGAYVGSAGGTGTAGTISVTVNGLVAAEGQGSPGIFVQSAGGASNSGFGDGGAATIYVGSPTNSDAQVFGGSYFGDAAAAIFIAEGTSANGAASLLQNYGIINTNDQQNGTAIYSAAADFVGENYNSITGNLNIAHGGVTNYGSGTVHPFSSINLSGGDFLNHGTLDLTSGPSETKLTGNYLGKSGSTIAVGADFLRGTSDHLTVTGDATVESALRFNSSTLVPTTVNVLTAEGSLDLVGAVESTEAPVFSFSPRVSGSSLLVTPSANFETAGLSDDEASLAGHLQRIWDGENPGALAHGFAALSTLGDQPSYAAALESLIDRQIGAIATARVDASRAFVANMNSCPKFVGSGLLMQESNCGWVRGIAGRLDTDGNASAAGFDADASTIQFGGQYEAWDNVFIAGSLGYESSMLNASDDMSSSSGSVWMGGLGVKYQSGPLLASAMVDFGTGSFDSTRTVVVGGQSFTATGTPDASNAGLHGRVSYQLPYDSFYLRPSFDLDASYISLDGYTESGAGEFNLDVAGSDGWVFAATPAVEIGTRVDTGNGTVLRPYLGVGVSFTSGNDWEIESRFAGAPASAGSFTSTIDNPDTLGVIRAGVEVMSSEHFDATVQYNGSFAEGYSANAGAVKLTWRF
jgi:hypothetical protein